MRFIVALAFLGSMILAASAASNTVVAYGATNATIPSTVSAADFNFRTVIYTTPASLTSGGIAYQTVFSTASNTTDEFVTAAMTSATGQFPPFFISSLFTAGAFTPPTTSAEFAALAFNASSSLIGTALTLVQEVATDGAITNQIQLSALSWSEFAQYKTSSASLSAYQSTATTIVGATAVTFYITVVRSEVLGVSSYGDILTPKSFDVLFEVQNWPLAAATSHIQLTTVSGWAVTGLTGNPQVGTTNFIAGNSMTMGNAAYFSTSGTATSGTTTGTTTSTITASQFINNAALLTSIPTNTFDLYIAAANGGKQAATVVTNLPAGDTSVIVDTSNGVEAPFTVAVATGTGKNSGFRAAVSFDLTMMALVFAILAIKFF